MRTVGWRGDVFIDGDKTPRVHAPEIDETTRERACARLTFVSLITNDAARNKLLLGLNATRWAAHRSSVIDDHLFANEE